MLAGMTSPDPSTTRDARLAAWERRTAWPMVILAVLFLGVYALPILRPGLPPAARTMCEAINIAIWMIFIVEFAGRLVLSTDRLRFLRTHVFDLIVLALPVLRPLRVLRLVTAVLLLVRRTETLVRGQLALYVGTTTVLLTLVAGLAVLDAERGAPDASITSYPEALWWSVVTITTVGYGDHFPVTTGGRVVAVALMIGGIGLIGFVTGSLASWIVERISAATPTPPATREDISAVLAELTELRSEVARLRDPAHFRPTVPRPTGDAPAPAPAPEGQVVTRTDPG
ncbi:potassium channel family protein [Plantactinospora sp. GCM10030261]|uniref:potassium channel family protein n=1 Tax=Plantactinospora sp. GCM10030261 TaxID=3273420 RepID=UPI003610C6C6